MPDSKEPILPGTTVIVNNQESIYNGYVGFVQRISGDKAAVLFEGGNWDKLLTLPLKDLAQTNE
tara:strand:- start:506 stop:697 length:192 start_codon:yes stop_codon:yes gene_type:complete